MVIKALYVYFRCWTVGQWYKVYGNYYSTEHLHYVGQVSIFS